MFSGNNIQVLEAFNSLWFNLRNRAPFSTLSCKSKIKAIAYIEGLAKLALFEDVSKYIDKRQVLLSVLKVVKRFDDQLMYKSFAILFDSIGIPEQVGGILTLSGEEQETNDHQVHRLCLTSPTTESGVTVYHLDTELTGLKRSINLEYDEAVYINIDSLKISSLKFEDKLIQKHLHYKDEYHEKDLSATDTGFDSGSSIPQLLYSQENSRHSSKCHNSNEPS